MTPQASRGLVQTTRTSKIENVATTVNGFKLSMGPDNASNLLIFISSNAWYSGSWIVGLIFETQI